MISNLMNTTTQHNLMNTTLMKTSKERFDIKKVAVFGKEMALIYLVPATKAIFFKALTGS